MVATLGVLAGSVDAGSAASAHGHRRHRGLPGSTGAVAPIGAEGRWFTDATGRVVQLRGVNEVNKSAPFYPAAAGFGADDARFLAAQGFNTVRLGVELRGLMPDPGRIDHTYLDGIARSVQALGREHVFVLLDFHQDGFGPKYNGNGFPDWMGIDDGLPNPPAEFPLYYVQNPAMQRAFESFWANRSGPAGVGLQDYFVQGVRAVVTRFRSDPYVIGYETINEPFPGADWQPCLRQGLGCPELEQRLLVPFAKKVTAAVRSLTTHQHVFVEPFVLFNFGQGPTSLPGKGSGSWLATHSYALDAAAEDRVADFAVDAAERDRAPVLMTEFGATNDVATLRRLTAGFDRRVVPWLFWAYNENIITDRSRPAGLDVVRDRPSFEALVRPYPVALTGVPQHLAYDPASRVLDLRYTTTGPRGERFRGGLVSVVSTPKLAYPGGYRVEASGARVTSRPDAERLTLRTSPHAGRVSVRVIPRLG